MQFAGAIDVTFDKYRSVIDWMGFSRLDKLSTDPSSLRAIHFDIVPFCKTSIGQLSDITSANP